MAPDVRVGTAAVSGDNSHLFVFTGVASNKAGVAADKKMVADFVYERSKHSDYTKRAQALDQKQQERIEATAAQMREMEMRMSDMDRASEERRGATALAALEEKRQLSRTYCVVDMDMYYAAVEIRDRPELATKPVAIGGVGMISTANYVARLYGVRSAMPGFIAQEMVRSPHLVGAKMPPDELIFVKPDFEKYTRVAEETRSIFRQYDKDMHAMSLDEAYLDLTDYLAEHGGPSAADRVVEELRARVKELTKITCSAGIGPNLMIAKIASDDNKPDGQFRVQPSAQAVLEYVESLPVRRIPGIGKVLERTLKVMLGVTTVGELRRAIPKVIRAFEGKSSKEFLLRSSLGLCHSEAYDSAAGLEIGEVGRKSLSNERTFSDEGSSEVLLKKLEELCGMVAEEMATSTPPLAAKSLSLKLKTASFEVRNRQVLCPSFVGFDAGFAEVAGPANLEEADAVAASSAAAAERERRWQEPDLFAAEVPHRSGAAASFGHGSSASASNKQVREPELFAAEVRRVSAELYARLSPLLKEQLPCSFRLMGVRVSSFRSARRVLDRGQQQLGRFFGAAASSAAVSTEDAAGGCGAVRAVGGRDGAVSSVAGRDGAVPVPSGAVVVDIDSEDDEQEALTLPRMMSSAVLLGSCEVASAAPPVSVPCAAASAGFASAAPSANVASAASNAQPHSRVATVQCPVCQVRVPIGEADQHVNSHYDATTPTHVRPVPQEAELSAGKSHEARRTRRRTQEGSGKQPCIAALLRRRPPADEDVEVIS